MHEWMTLARLIRFSEEARLNIVLLTIRRTISHPMLGGTQKAVHRVVSQIIGWITIIIPVCRISVMMWTASARYNLVFFISHCYKSHMERPELLISRWHCSYTLAVNVPEVFKIWAEGAFPAFPESVSLETKKVSGSPDSCLLTLCELFLPHLFSLATSDGLWRHGLMRRISLGLIQCQFSFYHNVISADFFSHVLELIHSGLGDTKSQTNEIRSSGLLVLRSCPNISGNLSYSSLSLYIRLLAPL